MRWAFLLMLFGLLAACGGRVAQPVILERDFDNQLNCAHIDNEFNVNIFRLAELARESGDKVMENLGWLVYLPIFLDMSGTEKEEVKALIARNERLKILAANKGCAALLPASAQSLEQPAESTANQGPDPLNTQP